ncbi:MAG: hypothetical protein LBL59_08870, partial [Xanthomonadaceae bacterium]|nr:hypothetical protein [Xanthomonadaceae bacterium]
MAEEIILDGNGGDGGGGQRRLQAKTAVKYSGRPACLVCGVPRHLPCSMPRGCLYRSDVRARIAAAVGRVICAARGKTGGNMIVQAYALPNPADRQGKRVRAVAISETWRVASRQAWRQSTGTRHSPPAPGGRRSVSMAGMQSVTGAMGCSEIHYMQCIENISISPLCLPRLQQVEAKGYGRAKMRRMKWSLWSVLCLGAVSACNAIEPERVGPQARVELPRIEADPAYVDYFLESYGGWRKDDPVYPVVHMRIPKASYFDPKASGPYRMYDEYITMFYPNFSGLADEENAECRGIAGRCRRQMTVGFGFGSKGHGDEIEAR